jgi:hypothetical protein
MMVGTPDFASFSYALGLKNWTKAAEQICPRVENVRKAATVKRNLESVQAALKDREKQYVAVQCIDAHVHS